MNNYTFGATEQPQAAASFSMAEDITGCEEDKLALVRGLPVLPSHYRLIIETSSTCKETWVGK
jgi:hypothetical protein